MRPKRNWRRWAPWLGSALLVSPLLAWAVMLALMHSWVATEPMPPGTPAITGLAPEARGDRVYLGRNWLGRREGLPVLYLTGGPFEMGYANGVLTREQIHRQENSMVALLNRVAPQRWMQFLLKFFVTWKNRRIGDSIIPELQLEMLGIGRGCPDIHPGLGPYYNRILNYHAAQDISYMLMNSPLIRRGCTAFGAWGAATVDDHLLCGRNFDWEADPVFSEDRLVIFCEPDEGIPFISLAWAGMVGCVSGLNRAGVSITVNGAPSTLPSEAATPTCLVAREVLQHAHNLAEAVEIIRRRQVFVSAMFLVGSRTDGRFIVVEKMPEQMAVLEPESGATFLACANHYLTPELRDTALNETYKRSDTSVSRFERITELLRGEKTRLGAARCAALLRDRLLPGGQNAGNGHRGSLNPLIATHAVVIDLTAGIFWAARPPHQLGDFVAFDVAAPEKSTPEQTLPADPMLTDGGYGRYLAAKDNLEAGNGALKRGDLHAAESSALAAEAMNPGDYQNAWLLAQVLARQRKFPEAAAACHRALAGRPALGEERAKIAGLLKRCTGQR